MGTTIAQKTRKKKKRRTNKKPLQRKSLACQVRKCRNLSILLIQPLQKDLVQQCTGMILYTTNFQYDIPVDYRKDP